MLQRNVGFSGHTTPELQSLWRRDHPTSCAITFWPSANLPEKEEWPLIPFHASPLANFLLANVKDLKESAVVLARSLRIHPINEDDRVTREHSNSSKGPKIMSHFYEAVMMYKCSCACMREIINTCLSFMAVGP